MRGANRNKQKFWYAMYDQTSEGTDECNNTFFMIQIVRIRMYI